MKSAAAAPPAQKRKPVVEIVYLGTILAIILLGIVQTVTPIWHFKELDERRPPAQLSDYIAALRTQDPQLPAKASEWFNDRFGFRAVLIRLYNELQYRLFGTSELIYVGKDGFLFYKKLVMDEQGDSRTPELVERTAGQIVRSFRNLSETLARRGIKLVIVSIPSKRDFYREYLPSDVPPMPNPFLQHRLRELLKLEPELIYVDASLPLEGARQPDGGKRPVYYRMDPHLDFWGSLVVAPTIVNAIAADAGMRAPPWREFHDPFEAVFPGLIEQRFLGLMSPLMEHIDGYRDMPGYMQDSDIGYFEKDWRFRNAETIDSNIVFEFAYHARPDHLQGRLPPVVIYGDSFADHFIITGLPDAFAAVYRSRQSDTPIADIVKNIPDGVKYFMIVYDENVAVRYSLPTYSITEP